MERARHILFEVIGIVAPAVDPVGLDPSAPLREAANLDPVSFMEMVALLSDALKVNIPRQDLHHLETIDSAVAYLGPRLG